MNSSRKSRNFCTVLYPESDIDLNTMKLIKEQYDYACILHNKDVDENGAIKKPHFHFVIKTQSPCYISTLSNHIQLNENRIEWCRNLTGAIRYLIHIDDPDKYQYSADEIEANFDFSKYFSMSLSAEEQAKVLTEFILNSNPTYTELLLFAIGNGCYSEFRRGSYMYRQIVMENLSNWRG